MIIAEPPQVKRTKEFQEFKYGIDEENLGMIIHILRNQLYSDKIAAVIREYSTNAADAHTEPVAINRPFEVTYPTTLMPEFRIRDFGPGLNMEEVEKTYIKLGRSTKRKSNRSNGCLGLGSKSGFAYSDAFTIISYCNGEKTTYQAYIDETREGRLIIVNNEPSTETGIEIIIPVNQPDINRFKQKANQIYAYFDSPPKITNGNSIVTLAPKTWAFGNLKAIMGNVVYPIDKDLAELVEAPSLTLHFEIGELDFAASREALEFTTKTKEAIKQKIATIKSTFNATLQKNLDQCPDEWEAKRLLIAIHRGEKLVLPKEHGKLYRGIMESTYPWRDKVLDCLPLTYSQNFACFRNIRKTADGTWNRNYTHNIKKNDLYVVVKVRNREEFEQKLHHNDYTGTKGKAIQRWKKKLTVAIQEVIARNPRKEIHLLVIHSKYATEHVFMPFLGGQIHHLDFPRKAKQPQGNDQNIELAYKFSRNWVRSNPTAIEAGKPGVYILKKNVQHEGLQASLSFVQTIKLLLEEPELQVYIATTPLMGRESIFEYAYKKLEKKNIEILELVHLSDINNWIRLAENTHSAKFKKVMAGYKERIAYYKSLPISFTALERICKVIHRHVQIKGSAGNKVSSHYPLLKFLNIYQKDVVEQYLKDADELEAYRAKDQNKKTP